MSDEDALLAAIAAHPDEDTPRLVFADWLDEHDQPIRAEFIRVQVDIARKQETLPRALLNPHVDLFKRNQELLDNHRDELLGPLAALPKGTRIEFRRGFVEEVTLRVVTFHRHLRAILAASPPPRVIIADGIGPVTWFLGFDVVSASSDPGRDLVSVVRTLPGEVIEDVERLESSNFHRYHWPRLEELDISGCRLGDANARAILAASFPILADLDLSENELTDAAVAAILDSGLPPQLKRLILGGNAITDSGAIELAERWPTGDADKLEHLNLRFTDIGPPGQQALLARFGGRIDLF